jgi:tetratricopeptide (TPR) repeat protein/predicted Ser/Thr protein kinase
VISSAEDLTLTSVGRTAAWWRVTTNPGQGGQSLAPGTLLAGRYELLEVLGKGGMGAVYKARDIELDRLVALKVIRPELAEDPKTLLRFKQELILARQVTHKNVIRIFDLGTQDGTKFITMEFVEGRDLSHLLTERRFRPREAAQIMRQVSRALEAAHAEGVIHRDLKPQNIMVDNAGRVLVMDFGLARSVEMSGLTQTGTVLGTPAYMSPEQAQGGVLDERSDLFSLGVIFYELLTGQLPFQADTIWGTLLKRTEGPPPAPISIIPDLPAPLSDIVMKCLAIDPAERLQTATEFALALDVWIGDGPFASVASSPTRSWQPQTAVPETAGTGRRRTLVARTVIPATPAVGRRPQILKWACAGVVLVSLIGGGLVVWNRVGQRARPAKPVSVIVADFENATGDSIFNGTLEPMLTLALEGSPFIDTVRRDRAMQVARQLQPGATALSESLARLVALREGISAVASGSVRQSGEYRIAARAVDAVSGREIARREITASDKESILKTIGKLAAPIRQALGDKTPESQQLAAAETFTAGSLEAAQSYATAQAQRFAGNGEAAVNSYLKSISLDPNFGSAYASLAAVYANLGQREEARKYYEIAMARIDRMTDREKYRTRGGYYLATMDPAKAIDEFSALVRQYPADTMGLSSLAFSYYLLRDMPKALGEGRRALEIYPKNVPYRNNVALYALYAGEFDTAAKEATTVLAQNPAYLKGYITLALAQLAQGEPVKTSETYDRLGKVSALGASFACTGVADLALYESRPKDANAALEKGVTEDLNNKSPTAAAKKLVMAAEAFLMEGQKSKAVESADRAVQLAKESVLFPAARVYAEAGQESKAAALATELGRKIEPLPQANSKLIEGELELARGRPRNAIKLFEESLKLSNTWLARFEMGRAYLAAGAFPQADSEFDLCLKRRGEATDVYLDEEQTYRFLPQVYYYLGVARQGLKSPGAADSFRIYLGLKAKDAPDPMVADARLRSAAR